MEAAISAVTGELVRQFIPFLINRFHSSSHAKSEEKKMAERLQHLLIRAGTVTVICTRASFSDLGMEILEPPALWPAGASPPEQVAWDPARPARRMIAGGRTGRFLRQGTRPTRIDPGTGTVQLVIKNNNKKAPLLEYRKRVMLELTGGDYTANRLPLDLVAILDVSSRMAGEKIDQLKRAMGFVIRKLSPMDRISIITFTKDARELCPLWMMTEASKKELLELIDTLVAHGSANMSAGLEKGVSVLSSRDSHQSNRVDAIMLMSDGEQRLKSYEDAIHVNTYNMPVYTFDFGSYSDLGVLSMVAAKSMGGTFSHVKDSGGLSMSFSQCLAGLLSVAVDYLNVTLAPVRSAARILKVTAGSYEVFRTGDSVTISFGKLHSKEVRKVIVDLLLPAVKSEGSWKILQVTYSHYRYEVSTHGGWKIPFEAPPETLTVWRTGMEASEDAVQAELRMEDARLQMANMIKEARDMADCGKLDDACDKLVEAQSMFLGQSNPLLRTELQDLLELFQNQYIYEKHGRAYAASSQSSHQRQRFRARGWDIETMRLFATPFMDKYLEQAKKFHQDPTMPLPSVDDDVAEEVGALTVNVAGGERVMESLSLCEEGMGHHSSFIATTKSTYIDPDADYYYSNQMPPHDSIKPDSSEAHAKGQGFRVWPWRRRS